MKNFLILWLAGEMHQFDAAFSDRLNDIMMMVYDLFIHIFCPIVFPFFPYNKNCSKCID